MLLRQIFDPDLAQYSYLIACQKTRQAMIIDPQRDVDRYLSLAEEEGVEIVAVAETHIHADFLSGAREMAARVGARVYLSGEGAPDWSYTWPVARDRAGADPAVVLLRDGATFAVGTVELRALATPGHTPEHLAFLVTDRGSGATDPVGIFSGDFLLVGDLGRPDLLELVGGVEGSRENGARDLYRSLRRLLDLDDHLLVWPAHGAGSSCGKAIGAIPVSTIGYEKRQNTTLGHAAEGEEAFVRAVLSDQPTPPTYFARMKRTNVAGPPLLPRLPRPRRLTADELGTVAAAGDAVVIDARTDRKAFMAAHLPGSIHAPANRSFSVAVGALLTEPTRPIVLLVEEAARERIVRDLVRIGFDQVVGYFDAETLDTHIRGGGEAASIRSISFEEAARESRSPDVAVVDVRDHFEFAEGHIPGAVNAPYTRLPEYLETRIPAGRRLVVHCESGARSAVASAWLAAEGREVLYVDDDWSAWEDQVGEVVTETRSEGSPG